MAGQAEKPPEPVEKPADLIGDGGDPAGQQALHQGVAGQQRGGERGPEGEAREQEADRVDQPPDPAEPVLPFDPCRHAKPFRRRSIRAESYHARPERQSGKSVLSHACDKCYLSDFTYISKNRQPNFNEG